MLETILESNLHFNIESNFWIQPQFQYWKLFLNLISISISETILEFNLDIIIENYSWT